MGYIAFIASVIAVSTVLSLFNVDSGTSRADQPDYHFVPYAGDIWGA